MLTTNFLYGIKHCHACGRREGCDMKNDPSSLVKEARVFKIINRGVRRAKFYNPIKISSKCVMFVPESRIQTSEQVKKKQTEKPKKVAVRIKDGRGRIIGIKDDLPGRAIKDEEI